MFEHLVELIAADQTEVDQKLAELKSSSVFDQNGRKIGLGDKTQADAYPTQRLRRQLLLLNLQAVRQLIVAE